MRCDIHPPFYPYLITRVGETEYIQEPHARRFPDAQLCAIAHRRAQESGLPTAMVFGPERAVFFEPDGSSSQSTKPPWGGQVIIKSGIGDLELVDMSVGEEPYTSGRKVHFDPARLVAREMAMKLWDVYNLECSHVASTRDPANPGIALAISLPDDMDAEALRKEIIAALPAGYALAIKWEAVEVAGPAGPASF